MREFFDSIPWTGTELVEVSQVHGTANVGDEVRLKVRWPNGRDGVICFRDCWELSELQPASVGERIIAADLSDVYVAGQQKMLHSDRPVRRYSFTTNARACAISIRAAHIEVLG